MYSSYQGGVSPEGGLELGRPGLRAKIISYQKIYGAVWKSSQTWVYSAKNTLFLTDFSPLHASLKTFGFCVSSIKSWLGKLSAKRLWYRNLFNAEMQWHPPGSCPANAEKQDAIRAYTWASLYYANSNVANLTSSETDVKRFFGSGTIECRNVVTAVTTNARPRRVFFCLLKPEFSWTSINCFHGFRTRSDREGSLVAEWKAKTLKDNFELRQYFLRSRIT